MLRRPAARRALAAVLVAAAASALAACAPDTKAEGPDPMTCPVIDSRDWAAWVNAMPGVDAQRTLIVTGEIDLPTPGYAVSLETGVADRSLRPVQELLLILAPPTDPVGQVVTPTPVRFETPAIAPEYRGVRVRCGDTLIADITDVPVAQ